MIKSVERCCFQSDRRRHDDEFLGSTDYATTERNENERFERTANDYPPLTCASCCDLATRLLESFDDGPCSSRLPDGCGENVGGNGAGDDGCHDHSECYCSRCWRMTNVKTAEICQTKTFGLLYARDDREFNDKCFPFIRSSKNSVECLPYTIFSNPSRVGYVLQIHFGLITHKRLNKRFVI